jgi:hypothetical protein
MNIFKEIYQAYKTIRYRSKIVNINMSDLINSNFESSCAIYKGFFGEPMIDNDLLTAIKQVKNENLVKKIRDCNSAIYSFGFELFTAKNHDGSYMKIMLTPRYDLRSYMSNKSIGKDQKEVIQLYKNLGGNVI